MGSGDTWRYHFPFQATYIVSIVSPISNPINSPRIEKKGMETNRHF